MRNLNENSSGIDRLCSEFRTEVSNVLNSVVANGQFVMDGNVLLESAFTIKLMSVSPFMFSIV